MNVAHCQFNLLESIFQLYSDSGPASQQASKQASKQDSPLPPTTPAAADMAGPSKRNLSFDLLVSNLSYSVTRPQLISIFEFFGRVDDITLHRDYEQDKTHAFIMIRRGSNGNSPLTAEINIKGRKAVIRNRHDIRNIPRKSRSIMLTSFSPPATFINDFILEHFLDFGVVINITPFKVNKTRKGASYCFLKFQEYPSAEAAIGEMLKDMLAPSIVLTLISISPPEKSPHRIGRAVFNAVLAKDF